MPLLELILINVIIIMLPRDKRKFQVTIDKNPFKEEKTFKRITPTDSVADEYFKYFKNEVLQNKSNNVKKGFEFQEGKKLYETVHKQVDKQFFMDFFHWMAGEDDKRPDDDAAKVTNKMKKLGVPYWEGSFPMVCREEIKKFVQQYDDEKFEMHKKIYDLRKGPYQRKEKWTLHDYYMYYKYILRDFKSGIDLETFNDEMGYANVLGNLPLITNQYNNTAVLTNNPPLYGTRRVLTHNNSVGDQNVTSGQYFKYMKNGRNGLEARQQNEDAPRFKSDFVYSYPMNEQDEEEGNISDGDYEFFDTVSDDEETRQNAPPPKKQKKLPTEIKNEKPPLSERKKESYKKLVEYTSRRAGEPSKEEQIANDEEIARQLQEEEEQRTRMDVEAPAPSPASQPPPPPPPQAPKLKNQPVREKRGDEARRRLSDVDRRLERALRSFDASRQREIEEQKKIEEEIKRQVNAEKLDALMALQQQIIEDKNFAAQLQREEDGKLAEKQSSEVGQLASEMSNMITRLQEAQSELPPIEELPSPRQAQAPAPASSPRQTRAPSQASSPSAASENPLEENAIPETPESEYSPEFRKFDEMMTESLNKLKTLMTGLLTLEDRRRPAKEFEKVYEDIRDAGGIDTYNKGMEKEIANRSWRPTEWDRNYGEEMKDLGRMFEEFRAKTSEIEEAAKQFTGREEEDAAKKGVDILKQGAHNAENVILNKRLHIIYNDLRRINDHFRQTGQILNEEMVNEIFDRIDAANTYMDLVNTYFSARGADLEKEPLGIGIRLKEVVNDINNYVANAVYRNDGGGFDRSSTPPPQQSAAPQGFTFNVAPKNPQMDAERAEVIRQSGATIQPTNIVRNEEVRQTREHVQRVLSDMDVEPHENMIVENVTAHFLPRSASRVEQIVNTVAQATSRTISDLSSYSSRSSDVEEMEIEFVNDNNEVDPRRAVEVIDSAVLEKSTGMAIGDRERSKSAENVLKNVVQTVQNDYSLDNKLRTRLITRAETPVSPLNAAQQALRIANDLVARIQTNDDAQITNIAYNQNEIHNAEVRSEIESALSQPEPPSPYERLKHAIESQNDRMFFDIVTGLYYKNPENEDDRIPASDLKRLLETHGNWRFVLITDTDGPRFVLRRAAPRNQKFNDLLDEQVSGHVVDALRNWSQTYTFTRWTRHTTQALNNIKVLRNEFLTNQKMSEIALNSTIDEAIANLNLSPKNSLSKFLTLYTYNLLLNRKNSLTTRKNTRSGSAAAAKQTLEEQLKKLKARIDSLNFTQ